jgi:hypothetical protein
MVTVCAWCQKYMGSKEPLHDPAVSHGICTACVERQTLTDSPVVVVSPNRVATIPLLQTLLRGAPDVTIVVDRRYNERRDGESDGNGNGHGNGNGAGQVGGHGSWSVFERRTDDRRRLSALYLV